MLRVTFTTVPSWTEVFSIGSWLTTVPEPVILTFKFFSFKRAFTWDKFFPIRLGTWVEIRVSSDSVYSLTIEFFNKEEPFTGYWSFTISELLPEVLHTKPAFSKIFLASATVLLVTFGRVMVLLESSLDPSDGICK